MYPRFRLFSFERTSTYTRTPRSNWTGKESISREQSDLL